MLLCLFLGLLLRGLRLRLLALRPLLQWVGGGGGGPGALHLLAQQVNMDVSPYTRLNMQGDAGGVQAMRVLDETIAAENGEALEAAE